MDKIYPQVFTALPKEKRDFLVKVFKIPGPTNPTHVVDQEVVDAGYSKDDLAHITLEKMCEYIGSQETFGRAWEITLAKVHAELNPPIATIQNINGEATAVDIVETVTITEPNGEVIEEKSEITIPESEIEIKKSFCDTCDSKGGRHLKECPKYIPIAPHSTTGYLKQYDK